MATSKLKRTPGMIKRIAETQALILNNPKLARMFETCYVSTLETTTAIMDDNTSYVMTGDIPAMWLRDSTAQVRHYIPEAKDDPELASILTGLIRRQIDMVLLDNYANAFNAKPCGAKWAEDETDFDHPQIWERKYEPDSLAAVIHLAYEYWQATGDSSIFTAKTKEALLQITDTLIREQRHFEESRYYFRRDVPPELVKTETLPNDGRGSAVGYTGMTWCGFRPSDDACEYGYLIPTNMDVVVSMMQAVQIFDTVYEDFEAATRAQTLAAEIHEGIQTYGIAELADFGPCYAFETDGLGHHLFMDDAGVPSLLSAPELGYLCISDTVYQNTRRLILSKENPYYYEGKYARGIGSPHAPEQHVWPMSLLIQALTTNDYREKEEILQTLLSTDAGSGQIHESFHADDPTIFTRDWFAWANSLFAQFILALASTEEGRRILGA